VRSVIYILLLFVDMSGSNYGSVGQFIVKNDDNMRGDGGRGLLKVFCTTSCLISSITTLVGHLYLQCFPTHHLWCLYACRRSRRGLVHGTPPHRPSDFDDLPGIY
jgi:hypothetical protein